MFDLLNVELPRWFSRKNAIIKLFNITIKREDSRIPKTIAGPAYFESYAMLYVTPKYTINHVPWTQEITCNSFCGVDGFDLFSIRLKLSVQS